MDMYLALTGLLTDDEAQPETAVKEELDETGDAAPAKKPAREITRQDTRYDIHQSRKLFV